MGSSQSTTQGSSTPEIKDKQVPISTGKKKEKLTGFALVQRKCRTKKRAYDRCSQQKHSAFLEGKEVEEGDDSQQTCDDLFEAYKDCIYLGMLKDRERRNVAAPRPESALADFQEDLEEE